MRAPPPTPRGDGRRTRVGLLGGSFNPAHDGHRHVSEMALKHLALDEVWWLVAPQNPLKPVAGMAPLGARLRTAQRVVHNPAVRVTALEDALGTRYTVATVRALATRFPRARFVWLMGADNLVEVPHWHDWAGLFHTLPIAVLARPSYSLKGATGKAAQRFARHRVQPERAAILADATPPAWVFLRIPLHRESGTRLRALRRGGTGAAAAPHHHHNGTGHGD